MTQLIDPTIPCPEREHIAYVPRPGHFRGLRIGLIENTKRNSEAVLLKIAEKLRVAYGMRVDVLLHKQQRAALTDAQIAEVQGKTDFVITGVGD